MKVPPNQIANRCLELRKRAKRGECLSPAEHKLIRHVFENYEEWYAATENLVFNETVPFGSNIRKPNQNY